MGQGGHTVWIMAGEASGDTYGAALARELRLMEPGIVLRGMGGDRMREAGVELYADSSDLAIIGVVELLPKLFFFIRLLRDMTRRAAAERPDAVVMIDYPGFNIRLSKRLKKLGIPVVYYVSPQVWAWKKGRVHTLARCVQRMLCIFPFEPECYAMTPLKAVFVGHPLLEILAPLKQNSQERDPSLVLILPGSRRSELQTLLKNFLLTAQEMQRQRPELHFAMPLTNEIRRAQAEKIIAETPLSKQFLDSLEISIGKTRELMCRASAGLAASGTVTVEAAILGLPVVVSYRGGFFTYIVAKMIVHLSSITIANLVTGRTVYQECLQYDSVPEKMVPAMMSILPGGARRQEVLDGIAECVGLLGDKMPVSHNVAQNVLEVIEEAEAAKASSNS